MSQVQTPWYAKAGHAIGLPDFGLSTKLTGVKNYYSNATPFGVTPYGFQPTQQQQQNIYKYPELSTPQGGNLGNYKRTAGMVQTPTYKTPTPTKSNATTKVQNTKPVTGTVQGTQTYDKGALQRAQQEGRFEGLQPAQRAAAQLQYESSKNQNQVDLNSIYGPLEDYYNNLMGNVQQSRSGVEDYVRGLFAPQFTQAQASKQTALGENQANIDTTRQQEQSLMNDARRRASELTKRNQRIWGGTSSAGEGFNNQLDQTMLQGMNEIQTTAAADVNALNRQRTQIESEYATLEQNINSQLQQAIRSEQDKFDQQIAAIEANRAETQSAKAAARADAIAELNANAQSLQQQAQSVLEQLGTNALSAIQQLYAAQQDYAGQRGLPVDWQNLPGVEYANYLPAMSDPTTGQQIIPSYLQRKRLTEGV